MLKLQPNDVTIERLKELLFTSRIEEFEIGCISEWAIVLDDRKATVPSLLEKIIEDEGLRCRIYTQARSAMLAPALVSVVGVFVGLAAGIEMLGHNLTTFNPDFEIRRSLGGKAVRVVNKRKIAEVKLAAETAKLARKQRRWLPPSD